MTAAQFLDIARTATQLGANILASAHPASIHAKGDRDLVTDVDIAIQNTIAEHLARATPTIGLLAEESADKPSIDAAEYLWVLDPIDGTSNFVHGLPLCAVSLALIHHGRSIVAVTHAPLLDRIYHATEGHGAYLNDQPIATSATKTLDAAIVSLGDYATGPDSVARNQQRLALTAGLIPNVERIRMFGAATLDLAFLAEGATDACIIMSNKPWDTAAGTLIAREAGAHITDITGARHTHRSASTVSTAPGITDQLAAMITSASKERTTR